MDSPPTHQPVRARPVQPALLVALSPLGVSGLVFLGIVFAAIGFQIGVLGSLLMAVGLQSPPFLAIGAIEARRAQQDLARTLALVLAPGAVLVVMTVQIASSESSTAGLGFLMLPFYTTAAALAGYLLGSALDWILSPLPRGARWPVIWAVTAAAGSAPLLYWGVP